MRDSDLVVVFGAVEGLVDEAVFKRLVLHVRAEPGPVHGKKGKPHLKRRIIGYNQAAQHLPWVVLVDLNQDAECAPPLQASWLPAPAAHMCFRFVVREIESWLLADRIRLAHFLRIPISSVPTDPEFIEHPKLSVVELAKRSRAREIREDILPRPGSGRLVGPAYSSRLIEFVTDTSIGWRPEVAAISADSLARCLRCLERLIKRFAFRSESET